MSEFNAGYEADVRRLLLEIHQEVQKQGTAIDLIRQSLYGEPGEGTPGLTRRLLILEQWAQRTQGIVSFWKWATWGVVAAIVTIFGMVLNYFKEVKP